MGNLRGLQHRQRCAFTIGNGIHNFATAINAVAPGKVPRISGLPRSTICNNAPVPYLNMAQFLHQLRER
jgi:hypothetical protein